MTPFYLSDWVALALAIHFGRPNLWVVLALVSNLAAGGSALMQAPFMLAVADMGAAWIIFSKGGTERTDFAAAVYLAMVPVSVAGWAFGFSDAATYAIIDALSYIAVGAIGGLDSGIRRMARAARYPLRRFGRRAPDGVAYEEVRAPVPVLSGNPQTDCR